MESFTYSELLRRLDGFDAWLIRIGLTPRPNDRVHEAIKMLRKADAASRKGRETGIYSDIQPREWFPIIEALEAHDVLLAFQNDSPTAIAPSLKRALSGPLHPLDETVRNRDGRNVWFELALAAEWRLRGALVSLEEPDLRLTSNGVPFLVACKRPATAERINGNIRDAIHQLQRNLNTSPPGTFGIAAISLSCVFNPGDKVFSGQMIELGKRLEDEVDKQRPYLRSVADARISCVLFHTATPSVGNGVDLLRASYSAAQELHPSIGSKTFAEHGQAMRSNPKRR
jgi:hypothetical protein